MVYNNSKSTPVYSAMTEMIYPIQMNNLTMIERLKEINILLEDNKFASNKVNELINDLKKEEILKGYTPSERERFNIASSLQKRAFKGTRPMLGLWNLNEADNKYYWTNTAIMVRIPKEDLQEGLYTTDSDFEIVDKKGRNIFSWKKNQQEYPNCNNVWLRNANETKVNIPTFMAFLKANKKEEIVSMTIKELVIYFNPEQIYNALVLSKVSEKETAILKYLTDMKPFQFEDNCLCTPMRAYEPGSIQNINLD